MTTLITGATGNTGSAILSVLVGRGVRTRAMVRREVGGIPATEVAVADLDDPAAVAAALDGVTTAYLVTPSSERAEEQQIRFADLAAKAGVGRLVVLSQLGAAEDSPVRFLRYHGAVERHVRELGIGYTFLRPNLYYQGLYAMAAPIAAGRLMAPIGAARVSAIDVRDIADVAAEALTDERHAGRTYTLTGPDALTHAELAAALTQALGHQVTFTDVPSDVFAEALRGVLPLWQLDGLLEDYAHYSRGEAAAVTPDVYEVTGHQPRGFADFARENRAVFASGTMAG
jgi:uncharacterized protein YbjT (DUF2867 family)